jgi:hypothetical protein
VLVVVKQEEAHESFGSELVEVLWSEQCSVELDHAISRCEHLSDLTSDAVMSVQELKLGNWIGSSIIVNGFRQFGVG